MGPKSANCCLVLSFWGTIMLVGAASYHILLMSDYSLLFLQNLVDENLYSTKLDSSCVM